VSLSSIAKYEKMTKALEKKSFFNNLQTVENFNILSEKIS